MFMEYVAAGAAAIAITSAGYGYMQKQKVETLTLQIASANAAVLTCNARLNNILEDIRSDNEIDNIPDADLRFAPDHWMRP